jgi:hypothetical protein
VGKSKPGEGGEVHGRTISLIGCGASGAYAPGPDDEEKEEVGYECDILYRQTAKNCTYDVGR